MTGDINEFLMIEPDIADYVKAVQQETFAKLNCMRIGLINEILPNNEVQCLITNKKLMGTNKDGTQIVKDYPPIYAKVWYMIGIDYPLTVGTPCLLLFNDREFDSFFATGQISSLNDLRTHSLNDCICIPLYQPTQDGNYNIKAPGKTLNINANRININSPDIYINGIKWESHAHINGNQGANTGGIVV